MKPKQLVWALFRIFSYAIVVINILTFGVFLYLIAPYTSYFFFNDLRFWKYLHFYHRYYVYSLKYIHELIWHKQSLIRDVLPLTSPPMDRPDPNRFHVSKNWRGPADSCGDCNRCCTFVTPCCFLDKTDKKCLCYGSLFWKFFNCGRFPSSREILLYCGCPKFETVDPYKKGTGIHSERRQKSSNFR